MNRIISLLFLFVMAFAVNAAESAVNAIARLNKEFEEAHVKGDAKALANQYTRDAICLWENEPPIKGRAAIEEAWKKLIGDGGVKAQVRTQEVQETGDWAYEMGTFVVTAAKGDVIHDGKYLVIWKREDGQWRMHRDCGNASRIIAAK